MFCIQLSSTVFFILFCILQAAPRSINLNFSYALQSPSTIHFPKSISRTPKMHSQILFSLLAAAALAAASHPESMLHARSALSSSDPSIYVRDETLQELALYARDVLLDEPSIYARSDLQAHEELLLAREAASVAAIKEKIHTKAHDVKEKAKDSLEHNHAMSKIKELQAGGCNFRSRLSCRLARWRC